MEGAIYNSRNYTGLLKAIIDREIPEIYNSRNYTGLLKVDGTGRGGISTIVEIILGY